MEPAQVRELKNLLHAYGVSEVEAIKGLASGAYRQAIGYAAEEEVVHRDNLVLI